MRKIRWLWFPLIVAVTLMLPWILFHLRPNRSLSVVVVDKTVPFDTYLEHDGFFWLLNQYKIVQPSGETYDRADDYLGAIPGPLPGDPPAETRDLTEAVALEADLLYVIDTYGVYEEDLASGEEKKAALERSHKIYGGLTSAEAHALQAARRNGTTVVVEFNTMASPTGREAAALVEETVGVRWTRWIGRYFAALEDRAEVPQWLRDVCRRELDRVWSFEGPGYVLLQDDTRCEVLLVGPDSPRIGLTIEPEYEARQTVLRDAATGTPYTFWFDLVIPGPETEVLASYRWELSEEGTRKLARLGLPARFPAVTRHRDATGTSAYYFAGDFGDSTVGGGRVPFAGFVSFRRWLETTRRVPSHQAFYYRFYVPLMTAILEEAEEAR